MRFEKYSKYKDSGIEWIGEIPEHWEVMKLKYVAQNIIGGGTPDTTNKIYWTDDLKKGYLWVSIEDISNSEKIEDTKKYISFEGLKNCSAKIIKPYSILYSIYASLGKVAYSEKSLTTNQAILAIEIKKEYHYKFLFYYLKTLTEIAINLSNSTTQNNISLQILKNLYCVFPPKQEQIEIAKFLDKKTASIDKAIKTKEKLIEKLKELKQSIINEAVTKGLNKDVKFKDSDIEWIGKIPEHWEVSKLGRLLIQVSIKNRADLPLLSVTREKGVILRDVEDRDSNHNFIPDDLRNYKVVQKNQFVINKMKAWQGSYGISNYTGIVSPAYYIFKLRKEIDVNFFHIAIRSKLAYVPFFKKASDGVRIGQWDLSKNRMKEIPFFIPPIEEQKQIVQYIQKQTANIDKAIELQQLEIEKLKEYKASLIDSVVTGKIKVT